MAKPILNKIHTFDANDQYKVGFSYKGNQTYSNRLVITNATTSRIIFDDIYIGFELYHIIPEKTLTNDEQYYAQIQCYDKDGNASALSDPIYFRCTRLPDFYFQDVINNMVIDTSYIQLDLVYHSIYNEKIRDYQFFLYDVNKTEAIKSQVFYTDEMSFRFIGLEDNKQYYVRATGTTVSDLAIDTGFIKINVQYKEPATPAKLKLSCDPCHGYITWATDIVFINCTNPRDYTFDNGFIELDGKEIEYNFGFLINGDFELKLIGKHLNRSGKLLTMSNKFNTITLSSFVYDDDDDLYFHLSVENALSTYNQYSKNMQVRHDDVLEFVIVRKNNMYELYIYKL